MRKKIGRFLSHPNHQVAAATCLAERFRELRCSVTKPSLFLNGRSELKLQPQLPSEYDEELFALRDNKKLVVVGCEGTAVNTGWKNGLIRRIEIHLRKSLRWAVCLLHFNELPFRQYLDGKSTINL
ncbi:hypothetical protein AVEN_124441-1 [Araneus ventricosus]|uniref:DUF4817 domain-containing protein n=1 Tax=Araneus ventricosus TaxID=182803 RepID=A0A4Y2HWI2_ARAVE|nr:hypothetical protein AVEN_124441-1 [Araneus ventricosus]